MSDHSVTFVPVATGYFQSPELFVRGRTVDTGLLAEALIFYDQILINVDNPHQFADLISWLVQQGLSHANLMRLIKDRSIQIYNYAFTTNPHVEPARGLIYGLYNFQDQVMIKPNSFAERFLRFEGLRNSFGTVRQYEKFCEAVDGRVVEVKSDEIGPEGIFNAWRDFLNPSRNALISRNLIREMYRIKRMGKPPGVKVAVKPIRSGQDFNELLARLSSQSGSILVRSPEEIGCGLHELNWDVDLTSLPGLEGPKIMFGATLPLSAAAMANKYIWSAAKLKCDLYLPRSVDSIVGDKLYEANQAVTQSQTKTRTFIRRLELKAAFPDIRRHVNLDKIDFDQVLRFRRNPKTKKFRRFLKAEADGDRDTLVAYLDESARSSGFTRVRKRVLPLLSAGAGFTSVVGGAMGSAKTAVLGGVASFLIGVGASIGTEWTPKVFGDWYGREITKLLKEEKNKT
jgi:hypothetical protein